MTSPLQVQCARPPLTVTTISFQSCGLYFVSADKGLALGYKQLMRVEQAWAAT